MPYEVRTLALINDKLIKLHYVAMYKYFVLIYTPFKPMISASLGTFRIKDRHHHLHCIPVIALNVDV